MTLCWDDEPAYDIMRRGITGGLSYVMHRRNIAGETPINYFETDSNNQIHSIDTDNIMTHVTGLDFNSLYPSAFSSIESKNNPYKEMYMPGRVKLVSYDKDYALSVINKHI
jgi:hypothetical protein